jgi:hypothetical protein
MNDLKSNNLKTDSKKYTTYLKKELSKFFNEEKLNEYGLYITKFDYKDESINIIPFTDLNEKELLEQNNPEINLKIHILEQYVLNGFENKFYCYKYFAEQYILHWAGMSIQDRNYFATIRYDEFLQGLFTGNKKQNRFCIK